MREVYRSFPIRKGKKSNLNDVFVNQRLRKHHEKGIPLLRTETFLCLCVQVEAPAMLLPSHSSHVVRWRFLRDYPAKANTLEESGRCFRRRRMFQTHSSALHWTCLGSSKAELVLRPKE